MNKEIIKQVKSHLKGYTPKGDIEGFPIQIVEAMCYNQIEQGNPLNVLAFENKKKG